MTMLTLTRGDTIRLVVSVTDIAGLAYDLTNVDLWFSIRHLLQKRLGDGISITDAAGGLAEITLDPTDTALAPDHKVLYRYDFQIKLSDGTVKTPAHGRLAIIPDVTIETNGGSI